MCHLQLTVARCVAQDKLTPAAMDGVLDEMREIFQDMDFSWLLDGIRDLIPVAAFRESFHLMEEPSFRSSCLSNGPCAGCPRGVPCFRQEQLQELRGQLRGPADVLGNLGFLDLKWHKWQFFWTPPQGEIQGPDLVESKRPSSSMPNWKLEVVDAFRETQAVSTRKCRTNTPRWTSLPSLRRSLLF